MKTIVCERRALKKILSRLRNESEDLESLINLLEPAFLEEDWDFAERIGISLQENISDLEAILKG